MRLQRIAFVLDHLNLKNACAVYFFLAPLLQDRIDRGFAFVVFLVAHLITGFITALAAAEWLSRFSGRIAFRPVSLLFLLMVASCFFSLLMNTPELLISPGAYYFKYLKVIFPVVCMFVMLNIWNLKDVPRLYAMMAAVAVISFILLVPERYLAVDHGGGVPRAGLLLFDDANRYAVFLNILYGLTFPMLIRAVMAKRPALGLVALNGLIVIALMMTQSRSGIFAFLVVTAIGVVATRSRRFAVYTALAFVPVLALLLLVMVYRYTGGAADSDVSRLWTYMVGLNIIRDRPFLGIGFGNITNVYDTYGGIYYVLLGRPLGIHNVMLEIFAEQGFFGFLAYMLMVFVPIGMLFKRIMGVWRVRYPVTELAAVSIPIVFFCYGLFYVTYLTEDYFWCYMAIPLIVLRSTVPEDFEMRIQGPKWV
jgi:O-antigen ligase